MEASDGKGRELLEPHKWVDIFFTTESGVLDVNRARVPVSRLREPQWAQANSMPS